MKKANTRREERNERRIQKWSQTEREREVYDRMIKIYIETEG